MKLIREGPFPGAATTTRNAIVLKRGGFAYVDISGPDHCDGGAIHVADQLLVTPPNDRRSVKVSPRFKDPKAGYGFGVCGSELGISPVFAVSGPFEGADGPVRP